MEEFVNEENASKAICKDNKRWGRNRQATNIQKCSIDGSKLCSSDGVGVPLPIRVDSMRGASGGIIEACSQQVGTMVLWETRPIGVHRSLVEPPKRV